MIYFHSSTFSSFFLILATVLALVSAGCLDIREANGLCSGCQADFINVGGYCQIPIIGCSRQVSQSQCVSCENEYRLINQSCAQVPPPPPSFQAPPVSPLPYPSSYVSQYSTPSFSPEFSILYNYFMNLYSKQLAGSALNLSLLVSLDTTYGKVWTMVWVDASNKQWMGEGSVDLFGAVKDFGFGKVVAMDRFDLSFALWVMDRRTVLSNLPLLKDALLNKVEQISSACFRFTYLTFTGSLYTIQILKPPFPAKPTTFSNLTHILYELNQDTVLNYVYSQHPTLQMESNFTFNYFTNYTENNTEIDYWRIVFGGLAEVQVMIQGVGLLQIKWKLPDSLIFFAGKNKNINGSTKNVISNNISPDAIPKNSALNTSNLISVGSFKAFNDINDRFFQSSMSYLFSQIPILKYLTLKSVQYQIVEGTNFMSTFSDAPFGSNIYTVVVYVPLRGIMQILSANKNGIPLSKVDQTDPFQNGKSYNYFADAPFANLYSYFLNQVSLSAPLPQIQTVVPLSNPDQTVTYIVTYSNSSKCSLLLNSLPNSSRPYTILNYYVEGVEVFNRLMDTADNKANPQINQVGSLSLNSNSTPALNSPPRSRKQILDGLGKAQFLFEDAVIINFTRSSTGIQYVLDVLTAYGTYSAKIVDRNSLFLSSFNRTSSLTCSPLSLQEATLNPVISYINASLSSQNSSFASLNLSAQISISPLSHQPQYRIVYANQSQRIEVIVSQLEGLYAPKSVITVDGSNCSSDQILFEGKCQGMCANS